MFSHNQKCTGEPLQFYHGQKEGAFCFEILKTYSNFKDIRILNNIINLRKFTKSQEIFMCQEIFFFF